MKTRKIALIGIFALALMASSCVGYGGYGYRPNYYYAPRPYVRVVPPPVFVRPPAYYYQPRPRYHQNYRNYGRNNKRNYGGRRRW